jgi:ABC-type bacteriocin/lantibiotic exporter with double-glycine peptidase domain
MNIKKALNLDIEPVFQGEVAECGLAAVCMLANSLGHAITLAELRLRWPAPVGGASLISLVDMLQSLGIRAFAAKFDVSETSQLETPCILHFGGNHFVLALQQRRGCIRLMNPATGEYFIPHDQVRVHLSGYAVALHPDQGALPRTGDLSHKAPKTPIQTIRKMALKVPRAYLLGTLAVGLLGFLPPIMYSLALDQSPLLEEIGATTAFLGFAAAFVIVAWISYRLERLSAARMAQSIRTHSPQLFDHLLERSMSYFDRRSPADIHQRINSFNDSVMRYPFLRVKRNASIAIGLALFGCMAIINLGLSMISIAALAAMGLCSLRLMKQMQAHTAELEEATGRRNGFILECLRNMLTIRTGDMKSARVKNYASRESRRASAFFGVSIVDAKQQTYFELVSNLEIVAILAIGVPLIMSHQLTPGTLVAFVFFRQLAVGTASTFFSTQLELARCSVSARRADDLLSYTSDEAAAGGATLSDGIEIVDLRHGYEDGSVLSGVNIHVRKGEKIAIIGASGSGKSTLLKVISGIYPMHAKRCAIDSVEAPGSHPFRHLVFHSTSAESIFNATVSDNLSLFVPSRIRNSSATCILDRLNLSQTLARLPSGLSTVISTEEPFLSTGELQRLQVARALLSDKAVIVLDEPTANLDSSNSGFVFKAIMASTKTVMVATHASHYLGEFDRIFMVEGGVVREVSGRTATDSAAGHAREGGDVTACSNRRESW